MLPHSSEHDSRHGERFNHDPQAHGYDADVAEETSPIRAGYAAALAWVAERCNSAAPEHILELGCGTGNLTTRLDAARISAVDISIRMLAQAAEKSGPRRHVQFVQADMLGFSRTLPAGSFDVITSTYALHHLTESEKPILLGLLARALRPAGRIVVADLMFACAADRERILAEFRRTGQGSIATDICDEFFWNVKEAARWLADLQFTVDWSHVSELTWCFCANR